jgi:hypothetical protein
MILADPKLQVARAETFWIRDWTRRLMYVLPVRIHVHATMVGRTNATRFVWLSIFVHFTRGHAALHWSRQLLGKHGTLHYVYYWTLYILLQTHFPAPNIFFTAKALEAKPSRGLQPGGLRGCMTVFRHSRVGYTQSYAVPGQT